MCDCMNVMLGKVQERVKEGLPGTADLSTFEADYQNRVFRLDGKPNNVMIGVDYSYFKNKKNGERMKNRTRDKVLLSMAYCPFCGEKHGTEGGE